ncbi:MAG: Crp/Fnr family transcriptional regulator [Actinomycetota bacterium]
MRGRSAQRTGPGPAVDVLESLPREELRGSFLSTLPEDAAERLLAGAIKITVPAGALVYREEENPRVIVVIEGLLRVFLRSPDGREVTVRYARSGDVAGLPLVLGGPGPMSVQTMTTASVAALGVETLRSMIASDPRVARAYAEEITRQLYVALADLSEQAFLSVRQRLVRHLLDLATTGSGRHLVVRTTQQELADAVGSAREVVTRTLRQLRKEGMLKTSRDKIVLLDPIVLSEEERSANAPSVPALQHRCGDHELGNDDEGEAERRQAVPTLLAHLLRTRAKRAQ